MKLYATTTSERASKGQGGNKRLDILVSDSERFEVAKIYFQINEEDNTATLRYWDRTMDGDGFISKIHLPKGKQKKDEKLYCGHCGNKKEEYEAYLCDACFQKDTENQVPL